MKCSLSFSRCLLGLSILMADGRTLAAPHWLKTFAEPTHYDQFRDIKAVPAGGDSWLRRAFARMRGS